MIVGTREHMAASDLDYQEHILQGVSRTFALTIPQLPDDLFRVVSNGYLLCRIADTIEDDPGLDAAEKRHFSESFVRVIAGELAAESFSAELHPLLSTSTLDAEKDLIENTARVIRITHGFRDRQRAALERCVRIMSRGMADFQQNKTLDGLADMAEMDRYCYYVAGVVGEMLTELFCDYSSEIDAHRPELQKLAVSFGQGLQMTNILKDIWEDRARGACWLPREVFQRVGFDLANLAGDYRREAFALGLTELIGIARLHLQNALSYTLLIPSHEVGIRRFCLWALGMAVLTLRKLYANMQFTSGQQVKISRRSVKAVVMASNLCVSSDFLLRLLFDGFTRSLPVAENPPKAILV
ncbi:MAG: phytoene/squalene synthase family protein [Gammaproteobacteria bacterium]|nr:MAG: phytoene/squalene synthase family protein [Gammaproteobacteria bacterium]